MFSGGRIIHLLQKVNPLIYIRLGIHTRVGSANDIGYHISKASLKLAKDI